MAKKKNKLEFTEEELRALPDDRPIESLEFTEEDIQDLPDDVSGIQNLKDLFTKEEIKILGAGDIKNINISDVVDRVNKVVRETATGATGGLFPEIEATARRPFTGETQEEALQAVQQEREQFQEEAPIAKQFSEATGEVLLGGGLGKAGIGGIGQAAVETGLRAASSGEDLVGTAIETGVGAGVAASLPPIAKKGISAASKLIKPVRSSTGKVVEVFPKLRSFAQRNAFKGLFFGGGTKGVTEEEAKKVGGTLLEEDLVNELRDPTKALKKISGGNEVFLDTLETPETAEIVEKSHLFDYFRTKRQDGLIGEISQSLNKDIDKISEEIPKHNLQKQVNEIVSDVTKGLAEGTTPITERGIPEDIIIKKVQDAKNLIENILRVSPDPGDIDNFKSLATIQDLKKNLGEKLNKVFRRVKDKDVRLAEDEIILSKTYLRLKDLIEELAEGSNVSVDGILMDGADYIRKQNARMHNLLKASQRLRKASERDLVKAGSAAALAREITTAVVGGVGAASIGAEPTTGAAAGFLLGGGARRIGKAAEKEFTLRSSIMANKIANVANMVANKRIPRTSRAVIENADLIAAKLAIFVSPQFSESFKNMVENDPQKVTTIVPSLIENIPDIFIPATFASEFDGKLHNTEDKLIFIDDINKNEELPPSQKAKIITDMNKNGKLPQDLDLLFPKVKVPLRAQDPLEQVIQGL